MTEKNEFTNRYFAAANGYSGFRSYFPLVFCPGEYSRLTVLKGGPGTGKSSFMKRIYSALTEKGLCGEAIFCSSDTASLDGVIFENGGARIAVIDGTAPHEQDAPLPGAVGKILNLGDGWAENWLRAEREKIEELNLQKSRAYKTAYNYLGISGKCDDFIKNSLRSLFDFSEAQKFASELIGGTYGKAKIKHRLVSSFGKSGPQRLTTLEDKARKLYSISGGEKARDFLMEVLCKEASMRRTEALLCPCALDGDVTDAVFLVEDGILFTGEGGGENLSADRFVARADRLLSEELKRAEEIKASALAEAVRYFAIASDIHFRLEEIYSGAMNFDKINEMCENELREIENILFG